MGTAALKKKNMEIDFIVHVLTGRYEVTIDDKRRIILPRELYRSLHGRVRSALLKPKIKIEQHGILYASEEGDVPLYLFQAIITKQDEEKAKDEIRIGRNSKLENYPSEVRKNVLFRTTTVENAVNTLARTTYAHLVKVGKAYVVCMTTSLDYEIEWHERQEDGMLTAREIARAMYGAKDRLVIDEQRRIMLPKVIREDTPSHNEDMKIYVRANGRYIFIVAKNLWDNIETDRTLEQFLSI